MRQKEAWGIEGRSENVDIAGRTNEKYTPRWRGSSSKKVQFLMGEWMNTILVGESLAKGRIIHTVGK